MLCVSSLIDRTRCQKPQGVYENVSDATGHTVYRVWLQMERDESRCDKTPRYSRLLSACRGLTPVVPLFGFESRFNRAGWS